MVPLDPSCVLRLNLDENQGTVAKDTSSQLHDGTIYGALWVDGKLGAALGYDGLDDQMRIDEQLLDLRTVKQITVIGWMNVYVDNTQAPPGVMQWKYAYVGQYNANDYTMTTEIPIYTSSPPVRTFIHYIHAQWKDGCGTANWNPGAWNLFSDIETGWSGWFMHAISVDARDESAIKVIEFVKDTFREITVDRSDRWQALNYIATNPCGAGGAPRFYVPGHSNGMPYWKMKSDELRVYNRALTAVEIKAQYERVMFWGLEEPPRIVTRTRKENAARDYTSHRNPVLTGIKEKYRKR